MSTHDRTCRCAPCQEERHAQNNRDLVLSLQQWVADHRLDSSNYSC